MKKRILCIALVLSFLLAVLPIGAAAQEETAEETAEVLDPEKLAADLAELNQRFLRTAADFENYKRRTAQEKEDLLKYSNAKLMTELLPVLDNFQLALKSPAESQEAQNVVKGVEMIYRQMLQILEQAGMAKIEAVQIVVQNGDAYCSDSIKKILGIEVNNDAGTDRE